MAVGDVPVAAVEVEVSADVGIGVGVSVGTWVAVGGGATPWSSDAASRYAESGAPPPDILTVNVTDSVPGGAVPDTVTGLNEVEVTVTVVERSPGLMERKSLSRKFTERVMSAAPPSDAA